jgi:hypothetical protein
MHYRIDLPEGSIKKVVGVGKQRRQYSWRANLNPFEVFAIQLAIKKR